ncbi:MAG: hypothetical protein GYA21_16400 [Myxococcales bacterium]|nr:hypothetical protein [Myxococcales bacterium]
MRTGSACLFLALALQLAGPVSPTRADEERAFTEVSARLSLSQLADFSGAAFSAALQGSLPMMPWLLVALRLGGEFPLRTGKMEGDRGLTLLALPALWGRFGDPDAWGYVRVSSGLAGQYGADGWEMGWVVEAAGGFSVAPRDLVVYFGVEAAGLLGIVGPRIRCVGLGGFVGYRF